MTAVANGGAKVPIVEADEGAGGGGRTERATGRRERSAPEPTHLEPRVSARAEGTRGAGETRDTVGCWDRTGVSRCDRVRTGGGLQQVSTEFFSLRTYRVPDLICLAVDALRFLPRFLMFLIKKFYMQHILQLHDSKKFYMQHILQLHDFFRCKLHIDRNNNMNKSTRAIPYQYAHIASDLVRKKNEISVHR